MAGGFIARAIYKLNPVVKGIEKGNVFIARGIAGLNMVMAGLLVYHVVMRYFVGSPSVWALPLTGRLFAPYWLLVGGYLVLQDSNPRMDILYRRFSPRKQALIDLLTYTLFFFYCGLVLRYGWDWFWLSYIRDARQSGLWRPLLWPFRLAVPVTFSLVLLAGIGRYIRKLYLAITGRELE